MKYAFDPAAGLIIVKAEVFGPEGSAVLRMALDTGATTTLINKSPLISIGFDPNASNDRTEVTTASGVESVPRITLNSLSSLGSNRRDFRILALTLPDSADVDGLLGLDFLENRQLHIDFQKFTVSLE